MNKYSFPFVAYKNKSHWQYFDKEGNSGKKYPLDTPPLDYFYDNNQAYIFCGNEKITINNLNEVDAITMALSNGDYIQEILHDFEYNFDKVSGNIEFYQKVLKSILYAIDGEKEFLSSQKHLVPNYKFQLLNSRETLAHELLNKLALKSTNTNSAIEQQL